MSGTGPAATAASVASTAYVAALVRSARVRPRRGLGQNFLVDRKVLARLIAAAGGPETGGLSGRAVLELGAGLGALTLALAEAGAGAIVAVEKDRTLIPFLAENVAPYPEVRLVIGDALNLDLRRVAEGASLVVGNLPYAVTTPLLLKLLEAPVFWSRAVVMVQLEVARRLLASPGGKDYGALTLAVAAVAKASMAFQVSRRCFHPQPGVDSAVMVLERAAPAGGLDQVGLARLAAVVRAAFGQRRKTLTNAVAAGLDLTRDEATVAILAADIDPGRRGETLSLDEFVALERALRSYRFGGKLSAGL